MFSGYSARKFAGRKQHHEGTDPHQLLCAALHNELIFLKYASRRHDGCDRCTVCKATRSKWKTCPECGTESYYLSRLIEVVTFFESEFALYLCEWTGIEYDAYIETSKKWFLEMPVERQQVALFGAERWWKEHDRR